MTSNLRTSRASNLSFKLLWVDDLLQSNHMITVRVFAWSEFAAAWQDCTLTTDWLKRIGDELIRHSFEFQSSHLILIDDRFFTAPLNIAMHPADSKGSVPIEIRFSLPERQFESLACSVLVRTEIGLLESFGKHVKRLADRELNSHCAMNPNLPLVPDYRYLMRFDDWRKA